MINFAVIAQLVHLFRMQGGNPAEIHLSKKTLDEIREYVRINGMPAKDTRSVLGRLRGEAIPGAPPPGVFLVAGLPAIENEGVADGCATIRPMETMQDPDWLEKMTRQVAQAPQPANETPWLAPQQASSDPEKIGVAALAGGSGRNRPSPTDVLMLAMEQADSMEEVIILKVTKGNGDVYMSSTLPKMAAQGYLHKALMKLIGE